MQVRVEYAGCTLKPLIILCAKVVECFFYGLNIIKPYELVPFLFRLQEQIFKNPVLVLKNEFGAYLKTGNLHTFSC